MVDNYKITILSDGIMGNFTIGEWGFGALVEVTSGGVTKRFFFDTGANPQTVVANAKTLGINICDVQDVILSHNHWDHTSGLDTMRSSCKDINPDAFKNAYIGGEEIFWPRVNADGSIAAAPQNYMLGEKPRYLAQGGTFILNSQPTPQFLGLPGVWLTGKIARNHDEKTYPGTPNIMNLAGVRGPDLMPEEHALVINTATGMVVVTGCAHAGLINTIEAAQAILGGAKPPVTIVGGIHLFSRPLGDENTEGTVAWVAHQLELNGAIGMLGGHCTGLERFAFLRKLLNLEDSAASYSTIGTRLSMSEGFTYTSPALNTPLVSPRESQLQAAACGTKPPTASCQATVSVWNYYLIDRINANARPLVIGDGTQVMTVQQYLAARTAAGF
jgi:7,8-dihydropterin-6-yl-methyl-4-(beta-D-ribofuranosyl)aminobenzene 5'-phosphate synthase